MAKEDKVDAGPARRQPHLRTASGHAGQHDGPTVSRIVLGTQLRRLREEAGITREAAGDAIRASHAKISRLELGRVGFKERDVIDLLDALRGHRRGAARGRPGPHAAGQHPRVVAAAQRRPADLVRELPAAGAGRQGDPHLPGAVRARADPERGVRPRRHRARAPGPLGLRDRPPRAAADGPAEDAAPARRPAPLGRDRRGRADPAVRAAAGDAGADRAPAGASARRRTSTSRSCRSAAARTPRRAGRSRSCGSPSRTCPTSSTSSSSPARSTSTSGRTSRTTS